MFVTTEMLSVRLSTISLNGRKIFNPIMKLLCNYNSEASLCRNTIRKYVTASHYPNYSRETFTFCNIKKSCNISAICISLLYDIALRHERLKDHTVQPR